VQYRNPATISLVNLVNDAAARIALKGEGAFTEFMTNGSRWKTGDTYIFVCDLRGLVYVHEDPSLIGTDAIDLKDKNGKPIVKWFIRKALGAGQSGWTHYVWAKPGQAAGSWKSAYLTLAKTPAGVPYVVGSGAYDMKMEKEFAIGAVNDAINLLGTKGTSAFAILKNKASEFVYNDTYVFVLDTSCNMLVDPADPASEGQNLRNMRDADGKFICREFVKVAHDQGSGWVDYLWPKPGTTKPVPKSSFVRRTVVDGQTYVVGTGIYPQ